MDTNRKQRDVLMGANRKGFDGDVHGGPTKMDVGPSLQLRKECQEAEAKGVVNYGREVEDVRPVVECDRKIIRTLELFEEADRKAATATSVSEVTQSGTPQLSQKMKPFDICQSSLDSPLPHESTEELMFENHVTGDVTRILRTGMVLLKNYIPLDDQVKIVRLCRRLGLGEGGFYQPEYVNGSKRNPQMMCLGLDWDPHTKIYGEIRRIDGARPPPIPDSFIPLTERAIAAAHDIINAGLSEGSAVDILPHMHPDVCIVNFYDTSGLLRLHKDKDESTESLRKGLPVVSISLGDSAMFAYGDDRNITKADKVLLESGDVLIFGGSSRLIFHGIESIIPHSAPAALQRATNLRPGRLNLTFREF